MKSFKQEKLEVDPNKKKNSISILKQEQDLKDLLAELESIQSKIYREYKVNDIYSNSKIFELVIADELGHLPIPGHSRSKDARNEEDIFEYKHYKETSSNHSWTFNDYSDSIIEKMKEVKSAIFAHINDTEYPPRMDWYIEIPGIICSEYLESRTKDLIKRKPKGKVNDRRMINFSPLQLERDLGIKKTYIDKRKNNGIFYLELKRIFEIIRQIEEITNIEQILTSNKLWEFLTSIHLDHRVLSEQAGHDAIDDDGNYYEYKVSITSSWNFQDISEKVLDKYLKDYKIILSIVDKQKFTIKEIYSADSTLVVKRLKEKLIEKRERFEEKGKELRRLQVSLSKGDLKRVNAKKIL